MAALSVVLLAGSVAAAQHNPAHDRGARGVGHSSHGNGNGYGHYAFPVGGAATGVPELDPNAAGAPLALLAGGLFVIAARRRNDAA